MNALQVTIIGVGKLKRPIWPETEDGSVYRQLLVQELEVTPGFTGRIFPDFHVVQNTFDTSANLRDFLKKQKTLLADMMNKARTYYEKDAGCSVEVEILIDEGGDRVLTVTDIDRPTSYIFK